MFFIRENIEKLALITLPVKLLIKKSLLHVGIFAREFTVCFHNFCEAVLVRPLNLAVYKSLKMVHV